MLQVSNLVLRFALLLALAASPLCAVGAEPDAAFAPVEDDARLPRVLLLGDSISIGYTPAVRQYLRGKANVHRAMTNCGPTTKGLAELDEWLRDQPWDVIHFNFGLHDLKYADAEGNLVATELGRQQTPPDQYGQNLQALVRRLRQTNATLIWATTTPVPPGAHGRIAGDELRYNSVAARIMHQAGQPPVVINDLHALTLPRLAEIQQPANVHFTDEGSQVLGKQVAKVIERHLPVKPSEPQTARGLVFHDVNKNREYDSGDKPLPGVRVSNGRHIVTTGEAGDYQLAVDSDTILFVLKPRGWRTPLNEDNLPQFYYIHKPYGSPILDFDGVSATGPLPESVDFPLEPQDEPDQFKAILFGDPQPRDIREVEYVTHDVIEELIGTDASFGVTLGDIAFDNLDTFQPQNRAIAVLGIPWYNVIGNHDINYDAHHDKHSDETFERIYGPPYYSFDYGPVHFLVLDDVRWYIDAADQRGRYVGGLGAEQIEFIKNDLAGIPENQLVVLMMHIPLSDVEDRHGLYRLIERRPFCMSISAHLHTHQHRFITREDGWLGPEPHHHVVNVTVSGSWWSGAPDERGIPHTTMADGAPNGYSIISFDGHEYRLDFRAAGRPADYQMNIYAPEVVAADKIAATDVYVNVFNGSERSTVEFRIDDDGSWHAMDRVVREDPAYRRIYDLETAVADRLLAASPDSPEPWRRLTKPKESTHIWHARLPAAIGPGIHKLTVRATDMHGTQFTDQRVMRVE